MRACWLLALGIFLNGCSLPRDAAGTVDFVRGGVMRVGVVHHPPWVVDHGEVVDGIEGRLVSAIAQRVGARVEWVRGPEFELIQSLSRRELQLVIGGFDVSLPWAEKVAFTRPYLKTPDGLAHVIAAAPGENAWL